MSEQDRSNDFLADLRTQVQELTVNDNLTPRTTELVKYMPLHRLLEDPIRAAIYNRGWEDRTTDIQEKLRTSSPPSSTTVRTYHGPRSLTMNKTVSETRLLWIIILYNIHQRRSHININIISCI